MNAKFFRIAPLVVVGLMASACAPTKVTDVLSNKSAVELRSIQTRDFDTKDSNKILRTTIATLQDLGYTIDKVEPPAGTVSATKFSLLKMTASVMPHGASQLSVRANAMILLGLKNTQVDDRAFYEQRFFEPLSKSLFLDALPVDGVPESQSGTSAVAPTPIASNAH